MGSWNLAVAGLSKSSKEFWEKLDLGNWPVMVVRFLFFLLLVLIQLEIRGGEGFSAVRRLSTPTATAGMVLEVSIELSMDNIRPAAAILSEILPEGMQFLSSAWNGIPFAPLFSDRQTLKWFFGPGGEAVGPGCLSYQVRIMPGPSQKVVFSGMLQGSGTVAEWVTGERILWLNPAMTSAPVFHPESGTSFSEELLISLTGDDTAGAALFLCFGEPLSWEDWQPYEGPFMIQHSQQLQAETWLPDNSASATGKAEYYRQCRFTLELQQGWNLAAIPLEIPVETQQILHGLLLFEPETGAVLPASAEIPAGRAVWLFSRGKRELDFSGTEPFQAGWSKPSHPGWQAVALRGLEDQVLPATGVTAWCWMENRFQPVGILQPGKGYWLMNLPEIP